MVGLVSITVHICFRIKNYEKNGKNFIVELFIGDTKYLSLFCARYYLVEYTLNSNSMIQIAPEL